MRLQLFIFRAVVVQGACSLQTGETLRNQDTGALSDRVCWLLLPWQSQHLHEVHWVAATYILSRPILKCGKLPGTPCHAWWAFAVPLLFLQVVPWCKAFTVLSLNSNIQTSVLFLCYDNLLAGRPGACPHLPQLSLSFLHCCLLNRCNYSPINLMQHFFPHHPLQIHPNTADSCRLCDSS